MNIVTICVSSFLAYVSLLFYYYLSDNKKRNKILKEQNQSTLNKIKDIAKEDANKSTDSLEEIKGRLKKYVRKT